MSVECVLYIDVLPQVGQVRHLPVVVAQPLHVVAILLGLRLLAPRVLRVAELGLLLPITVRAVQ